MGAIGILSTTSLAQKATAPVPAVQSPGSTGQDGAALKAQGMDTDNVEEQVGDQNEADDGEDTAGADTDNIEEQVGDQNEADDGENTAAEDTDTIQE